MNNVKRYRIRIRENNVEKSKPHSCYFTYKIRFGSNKIPVFKTVFINIHSITSARLKRLQNSLVTTCHSPRDERSRNKNRFGMYPSCVIDLIKNHIMLFKPRQSHYPRRKKPDRASTVKDMLKMILEQYFINVPYKIYKI